MRRGQGPKEQTHLKVMQGKRTPPGEGKGETERREETSVSAEWPAGSGDAGGQPGTHAVAEGSAGVQGVGMEARGPLPGSFFPMGKELRQRVWRFGSGFILFLKCRELKTMSWWERTLGERG